MDSRTAGTSRRRGKRNALSHLRKADGSSASFGSIRFPGSKAEPSKFLRIATSTEPKDVVELMLSAWGIVPPCAIISVVGSEPALLDEDEEQFGTELGLVVRRALAETMRVTNAWSITRGRTGGASSQAGAAVATLAQSARLRRDGGAKMTCVGVLPWEGVLGREKLGEMQNGRVAVYDVQAEVAALASTPTDQVSSRVALLDQNHTHFLLVESAGGCDSGESAAAGGSTRGRVSPFSRVASKIKLVGADEGAAPPAGLMADYAALASRVAAKKAEAHAAAYGGVYEHAQEFRSRLERYLSGSDISKDGVTTPKLVLLMGGDELALREAHLTLLEADEVASAPVLVVRGSGGAADDLWRAWEMCSSGVDLRACTSWLDELTDERPPEYLQAAARLIPPMMDAAMEDEEKLQARPRVTRPRVHA